MWLSREQKKEEICTWCEMALTQRETGVTQVERLMGALWLLSILPRWHEPWLLG